MNRPTDPTERFPSSEKFTPEYRRPLKHGAAAVGLFLLGISLLLGPLLIGSRLWICILVLSTCPFGFCLAMFGFVFCFQVLATIGTSVTESREGLIVDRLGRRWFYPWDRMEAIWNAGNHAHHGGRNRWPCTYRIVMNHGMVLNLSYLNGLPRLGQIIEKETAHRMVPAILEQYKLGQTISFERISVNNQGIVKGNFTSPWSEIGHWTFDLDGWLTIERIDKPWSEWIVVSPNKVLSLHLLLLLLGKVKGDGKVAPIATSD